ncbi:1407_t:CDS:2 [Entrophospora sp. SA101]|nr:6846_t:CDS:2 [Entrophospora sp. SA101]CAJ0641864.1 1407_t:CDS:2 [Entrophospora sp. SA101]CAJ0829182.1 18604_t:CDS:2 [Entrophospora sp. SA101]
MPVSTDQINVNWTLENLETRIKDNSEYINSLIGLIPPKYYFKNDPNNDETNSNTKINDEFQPNKRKRFSKQELKKQKKEAKKQKLKKKSENFKKLERKDPEKAMIVKEKDAWNKVFRKAEGEKIKDDLKLLKKTVKRGAIKKKKSEKSWNERIETIAKNINEKQEKRKSNIQTRIEEKKKKV